MVGKAYACMFRRVTAAGLTTLVATALAVVLPAEASAAGDPQSDPNWREKRLAQWPDLPESPSMPGRYHLPGSPIPAASMPAARAAEVKWPTAAVANISVPAGRAAAASKSQTTANVGGLPVRLQRPMGTNASALNARVEVLDQATTKAAGMTGVMLKVSPAGVTDTGDAQLSVDYTSLVRASGGDWASRLRLVALPACAAVTPQLRECHQITPLKSVNDTRTKTVTATVSLPEAGRETAGRSAGTVSLGGQVYALQAAASGPNGDWSSTPLNPSATWDVSAQTGNFSWSYALPVPPSVGGPAPDLALSYSSGSIDGKVASTNNQTSWIGDGWELENGYVERKYVSCVEDATGNANNVNHKTGDLCWKSDNATLSLNGRASELIKDKTSGKWRLKNDDASKVERLTGAWNGDNDTEYWKVTTSDGTQYFFGRDQRSASDTTALSSAWTVPVYGNNPNEPCYGASFASSSCSQAWRWNLDYVVDPHGNTMTYFYTPEWNY